MKSWKKNSKETKKLQIIIFPLLPWPTQICRPKQKHFLFQNVAYKGQLNSEWTYEVIVSPKMPTKNHQDFCLGSLLEVRAEILVIFSWHFGRNDDLINSFWTDL